MKNIVYFLDKNTFEIIDVVQSRDYHINLDEETNAKSYISTIKKLKAKAGDIVFIVDDETKYMGVVEELTSNAEGYEVRAKYISNLFNRKLILKNSDIIKEQGIEDFIAHTIENEFVNSKDALLNMNYIDIEVLTHTPKKFSVDTENGIYNFHTFITNCTQNYNIVYTFAIVNKRLKVTIANIEDEGIQLIDANIKNIINYVERFKTDVIAKVVVYCNEKEYEYFLLNDRTTTQDINDENRAVGETETVYERLEEDIRQAALNVFKSNSYSHLIQFDVHKDTTLYDVKNWKIGTRLKIKNQEGEIIDTYISAITKNKDNPIWSVKTGNIRINFLDKIKQKNI